MISESYYRNIITERLSNFVCCQTKQRWVETNAGGRAIEKVIQALKSIFIRVVDSANHFDSSKNDSYSILDTKN